MSRPLVFVSYCRKDAIWRDELVAEVLAPYKQQGLIDYWLDTSLEPGEEHKDEILKNLNAAAVTIFLVSPGFAASWFIQTEELPRVLKAHQEGRTKILWVLLKPMDLALVKDLAALQAVENPTHPLSGMSEHERSVLWMNLGTHLRKLAEAAPKPVVALEKQVPAVPIPEPERRRPAPRDREHISVVYGDLALEAADVTIVSASSTFNADGGIEMAVHKAAGPRLRPALREALRGRERLGVAEVCVTPGFDHPSRTLVHAMAPRWRNDPRNDLALLHQTYDSAFEAAIAAGARSVALGSFGTGHKKFPADVVPGIAIEAARRALARGPEDLVIRFVVRDPVVKAGLEEELRDTGAKEWFERMPN